MKRLISFFKDCFIISLKTLTIIFFLILIIAVCINPLLSNFGRRINLKRLLEHKGIYPEDLGKELTEGSKEDLEKIIKSRAKATLEELKEVQAGIYLTQEYPGTQGYNYRQSIDLRNKPAVMRYQEKEQKFYVGIANIRVNKNYKNPTLFLNFGGKVNVRVDPKISAGWVEMDPNFSYNIALNGDLKPLVTYRLNSLLVKFPEEGDYPVHFGIRGDNELPVNGDFLIKVRK